MSEFSAELADWVGNRLPGRNVVANRRRDVVSLPQVGDVVRIDPMDFDGRPSAIALICSVDLLLGVASVVLASHEVEMASEVDRIIPMSEDGPPYALLLLNDLISHVWLVQVDATICHLPTDALNLAMTGLPLRDECDVRWKWKESQLQLLQSLSSECVSELLVEQDAPIIDPAAFEIGRVQEDDFAQDALRVMRLLRQHAARLPVSAVLTDASVENVSHRRMTDALSAVRSAIMQDPASGYWTRSAPGSELKTTVDGRLMNGQDLLLEVVADHVATGRRCVTILSTDEMWQTALGNEDVVGVFAASVSDARCQVVAIRLREEDAADV